MNVVSCSLRFVVVALLAVGCVSSSKSPVRINEVLPSNSKGCADEVGERNDWVELYNPSDEAVDLEGYSLTDDTASPDKSIIPAGVTIEGRGVLQFWADNTPDQGKNHLRFKLGSTADQVVLYDNEGRQVDLVRWGIASDPVLFMAYSDVSFARVPDGTGAWARCKPSCNETNPASCDTSP